MNIAVFLITIILSGNTFAFVCKSDDNSAKILKIEKNVSNLVTGSSSIRIVDNVFAGTMIKSVFEEETYTLYNQAGKLFTLFVVKKSSNGHCRARVCDRPFPHQTTAKLTIEGYEDEYFTCL